MPTPSARLSEILQRAVALGAVPAVTDAAIRQRIEFVCRCLSNRAGVRLLMACMLAKLDRPEVDPRKPYTEIGGPDCFSGRTYDEQYLTHFINENRLPCNPTTAFLTPTLRNHDSPLTTTTDLVGRPRQMYKDTLQTLDDVANNRVTAESVLIETVRYLLAIRDERRARMDGLIASLHRDTDALPLSSEAIVTLMEQHLACKNSSRLPVLMVAAAYTAATQSIGERALPLQAHNAADEQTGAIGDVEVCLLNDEKLCTIYEMKSKRVTIDDIDRALQKIAVRTARIDNYIFVTTDRIDPDVRDYAASLYESTNGTEFAILDCIGFVRHFVHFFHRRRIAFLDAYQALVLAEPGSAVNQPLKEAFLTLRQSAEADE